MTSSDSIANLLKSFTAAWAQIPGAPKDATNPHFRREYASLPGVVDLVRPILAKHDLCVIQPLETVDGKPFVNTTVIHSTGEWISFRTEVVVAKPNDPQAFGSGVTYMRRYALMSILEMVAADEDDDGNAAMPEKKEAPKKAAVEEPPTDIVFVSDEERKQLEDDIEEFVKDDKKREAALAALKKITDLSRASYDKWVKKIEEYKNEQA